MAGKRDWSIAFYGLIAAAVVGVAIFGMWAAGLLGGDNTGAGLAFGGTLLTGAVSFVGLVLNEREKDRLDVEAATEAATLLSTADAKPADRATTAGALLSLARLGQVHLASSMLFDLWGQDRISTADGVFIVNEALSSRNPQAQRDASTILFLKTPELTARGEKDEWYYWPYVIDHRWVARLPFEARYNLLQAWVYLWTESTVASTKYRLRNLTAGLLACWEKEPDKMLRTSISDMLRMVYGEYCDLRATEFVNDEMKTFNKAYIEAELDADASRVDVSDDFEKLQKVLGKWLKEPDKNRTEGFLLPDERQDANRLAVKEWYAMPR